MIRRDLMERLQAAARSFPVVTVTGPRQSGKTTLCRSVFSDHPHANLEVPDVRTFALEDPRAFLAQYPEGAILDEVQRCPDLISYLQHLVDEDPTPGRWILTGSQNLLLLESVSQSLAGRTAVHHLLPLTRNEITRFPTYPQTLDETILQGGYPRIIDRGIPPADFLDAYLATYVERDVRMVKNVGDLVSFQRFLALCAGRTAQLLNLSALAADAGLTQPTAKSWLSILEAGFVVTRVPAFARNVRKRLVKMPKLHFYDTGLACRLLGIHDPEQLRLHPLRGALFETWVVSEVLKYRAHLGETGGVSHYRDHRGTEVDLVVEHLDFTILIEAKAGQTVTPDTIRAMARMKTNWAGKSLGGAKVVHGGERRWTQSEIEIAPWTSLPQAAAVFDEKREIEIWTALGFLTHFNEHERSDYRIIELGDAPDVRCRNSTGAVLNLEVTLAEDRSRDIPALLGRSSTRDPERVERRKGQGIPLEQMVERILHKFKKDYGADVALVVRDTSGADWDWDWVLDEIRDRLPLDENPFDRGVWILDSRKTRLFRVLPSEC